jgi:hypothetical protein
MTILSLIAAAQQPCAMPSALASFSQSSPPWQNVAVEAGPAVRMPLTRDPKLAVKPEKMPAPGMHGRALRSDVARAGCVRVAVEAPIRIKRAHGGQHRIRSVTPDHSPARSDVREVVGFNFAPGSHTVRMSGAAEPVAMLLIARL